MVAKVCIVQQEDRFFCSLEVSALYVYLRHVAGLQELLRIALAAVVFVVVGVIVGR